MPDGDLRATPRRSQIVRWLLAEKALQHAFVTFGFATNRFNLRDDASLDYRWFAVSGGIVAVLFAIALVGHLQRRHWSVPLYIGLATFDIVGEFVYQGGPGILITVSFIVAIVLLALGLSELRGRAPQLNGT